MDWWTMLLVVVQLYCFRFFGLCFGVSFALIVNLWWRQRGRRIHLCVLMFRLFPRVLYRPRICPKEQGGRSTFWIFRVSCDWYSVLGIANIAGSRIWELVACVHI